MGVPGRASFRVGVGRDTTEDDIERFLRGLPDLVGRLRRVDSASEAAMARYLPD
jgi:cysteine sulfinate desulfinase/cysteine desulfurase-like protein